MTVTITVNDNIGDQFMAFLKTLPKDAVEVESSRPLYADEVKRHVEEYKSGKMETVLHKEVWERIERQIEV